MDIYQKNINKGSVTFRFTRVAHEGLVFRVTQVGIARLFAKR